MIDDVSNCIDLLTQEIKSQKSKEDTFDTTGLIKQGKIQGLEIARMILSNYWEENC